MPGYYRAREWGSPAFREAFLDLGDAGAPGSRAEGLQVAGEASDEELPCALASGYAQHRCIGRTTD